MGRSIGGKHGLRRQLRASSAILPYELDAICDADTGSHVWTFEGPGFIRLIG